MTSFDDILQTNARGKIRRARAREELAQRYGERYREYRRQYEAAGRLEFTPGFPIYLMLEQTYQCNLRCPMCIQGLPDERKAFEPGLKRMPRELFDRIVLEGERHGCPSIAMMVNDEPLLVPDLPSRIAFAKAHGFMEIYMTTNGVLFTEKKVNAVIDAGVTHILFSIDAATQETYDKVRLGGDYTKVQRAIEMVVRAREARGGALPLIRASFVQNRLNEHETEAFRAKFEPIVDFVEIQGYSSYYARTDHLIPLGARKVESFSCSQPSRNLIVRANGDVLPCCTFYGYELVIGNVRETSLFDLFNGPRLSQFRADFKDGLYTEGPCQSCSRSFYMPTVAAEA
jgi:radical SAM protein with 4Fe4S-binding SPASM domain